MEKKEIDIYTLAEWDVFWAVLHNFLGWAKQCTYSLPLEPRNYDPESERESLLIWVATRGGVLHIHHLFKPFVDSDLPQYQRKFTDNAMQLIHRIFKIEHLCVIWEIEEEEKKKLRSISPILYERIFEEEHRRVGFTCV